MDMSDFQQGAHEAFAAETPRNVGRDFNREHRRQVGNRRPLTWQPLRDDESNGYSTAMREQCAAFGHLAESCLFTIKTAEPCLEA